VKSPKRRYQKWLRAYPKGYRNVRGEEILSTLLDASSEGDRNGLRDFLPVVAHGARVRLAVTAKRFGRGSLPRPVRGAIACLLLVAALNLLASVTGHNGPKNPSDHLGNIVMGLGLVGLCVLLKAWSRSLYITVMVALVALMSTNFVNTYTTSELNIVVPLVTLVVPLLLLVVGFLAITESHDL